VIYPFTVITGRVTIGARCRVGPLAHLRDGTILEDEVEVGAFVETKESRLGRGTVARHLAYLGNAQIGEHVNIGATTITANFDGRNKHATKIGDRTKIGAGAVLIAPVKIGSDAVVGANAVVTRDHDVCDGQTVVGVPAKPLPPK
jgi:bifunctional UDP-N-acetylglucosamine pyrophosphorylase/glucosamine-1-phosphate N-acetyltransferase